MITKELGLDFVNERYQKRWFRRQLDGTVCRLEAIGNKFAEVSVLQGDSLETAAWANDDGFVRVPSEEFPDLSAFRYPDLGYRSDTRGTKVWMLSRTLGTKRGLYSGNLELDLIAPARAAAEEPALADAQKAFLVFNPNFVPLHEAIAKLTAHPRALKGFALSHLFAISRRSTTVKDYQLHFSGKIVGAVSANNNVDIRSTVVKRMFDKQAA